MSVKLKSFRKLLQSESANHGGEIIAAVEETQDFDRKHGNHDD